MGCSAGTDSIRGEQRLVVRICLREMSLVSKVCLRASRKTELSNVKGRVLKA